MPIKTYLVDSSTCNTIEVWSNETVWKGIGWNGVRFASFELMREGANIEHGLGILDRLNSVNLKCHVVERNNNNSNVA